MTEKTQIAENSAPPLLRDFMSELALASELGVSTKTIARWRKSGRGPRRTRIGKSVFYRRTAVTEWLAECERQSTARKPRRTRSSRAA
jgi:predicted DNA-binding transcriptional regulator AlpA